MAKKQNITGMSVSWVDLRIIILYLRPHPQPPLQGERGVICFDVYKDKASPPTPLRGEGGVICLVVYLLRLTGWGGAVGLVGLVRQVRQSRLVGQIKPYFISNADTLALFPPEFSSSRVL